MIKLKILVIEDNPSDVRLVKELLLDSTLFHFDLIDADVLEKAIEIINRETAIDIVLLDLGLPDSQGLDTLKFINQLIPNTPIVILTGLEDEEIATTAVAQGAQDYFVKGKFDGHTLSRSITYAIERKKSEKILREYAAIIESADVAIISETLEGEITSWNKKAEDLFNYSAAEMIGKHISVLSPGDEVDDTSRILEAVKSDEKVVQYETLKISKNQKKIHVAITASPIKDAFDKILGASLIISNITARKLLEQQIAIQYRIAIALTEAVNLNNAAHTILKSVCEILNWQIGEIWLLDKDANQLKCLTSWQASHEFDEFESISKKIFFYKGLGLVGGIWDQKKVLWKNDIKQEVAKRREMLVKFGLISCFGFPIIDQDEFIGVMLFFSKTMINPDPSFVAMFTSISEQIGTFIKRKFDEERIFYLAQHDSLTGLANRSVFADNLTIAIKTAQVNHTMVSMIFLDLDNFKKINYAYGHAKGDRLLCEIGRRLKSVLAEKNLLARFSADEFVILLPEIKTIEEIENIAKKIQMCMLDPFLIDEKEFYLTVSMGISIYPNDGKDFETMLKSADIALRYAKEVGRNNYQFCSPNVLGLAEQRIYLENQLHQAVKNNEFRLYYQPIVSIDTGNVEGLEALVRWYHSDGRIILPSEFIPIIEESNLITEVGDWVISTACQQIRIWQDHGINLIVSVNVSPNQLNRNLISTISNILSKLQLDPKYLAIELTESVFMQETEVNMNLLYSLKELGLSLHIDDFGTGYSSLGYLKNFSVDFLKIDKSFIINVHDDKNLATIVNAIVVMAHALSIKTIAEGVEYKEQLEVLRHIGCDYYQGLYCSKALPPEELMNVLKTRMHS